MSFLRVWQYLAAAKVTGDYLEFGVFKGASFELSLRAASKFFRKGSPNSPRFFAFDSFEGLSPPNPDHDADVFHTGEYASTQVAFLRNIRRAVKGWEVFTIPGFYGKSLTPEVYEKYSLKTASFINIDCDVYLATLDVLRFVTPLVKTGTVIYFDDWFYSGGDLEKGEAGACKKWLAENPDINLNAYADSGVMGKFFIVNRKTKNP
jgi:O-methyltransferase